MFGFLKEALRFDEEADADLLGITFFAAIVISAFSFPSLNVAVFLTADLLLLADFLMVDSA